MANSLQPILRLTSGFHTIRDTLQSVSRENIFAVGDCATSINNPIPKSGVYAVRQAPILYHNVRAFLLGRKSPLSLKKVLSLLSLGESRAIASKGGFILMEAGRRWKDWIDRRFMKTFYSLPEMQIKQQTLWSGIRIKNVLWGLRFESKR